MSKPVAFGIVLALFGILTAHAIDVHGYVGFFETLASSAAGVTAFADLAIALSLVMLWMWNDSYERELPLLPYVLLTLAFGSAGPLAYLIHRELRARGMSRVLV